MSDYIDTERIREIVRALNEYQDGDGYDVYGDVIEKLPEFDAAINKDFINSEDEDEFSLKENTFFEENDEGWWSAYRERGNKKIWQMHSDGTIHVLRGKTWKPVGLPPSQEH
ncbi:hypothetical protein AB0G15_05700 [Streptosporangium sp. NPDC023825]|uniref:hypothetical protein n=1 Tax=Streptosporangium sp. NPDC023825 TaxID=3154909 RepID=UPI003421630C